MKFEMQIRFIIWSKSNEFDSTFRFEYIFNLVLKFQNKQVWPKWISNSKITSKALGLIMSIISDMLFMPKWSQLFLILYVSRTFTLKLQDKMNKA